MEKRIRRYNIIVASIVFIGLPILFWALGDFPRRSSLKEILSVLTLVAFSLMLGQFFLARSNKKVLTGHKMSTIIKYHKYIGYIFVSVLLLHPFLLVLPRYFESGVEPTDAFITIITTTNSIGVVLGIIAYCLLLILGLTSIFRNQLKMSYKTWRVFHGILSIVFIAIATIHVIDLGRHTNTAMISYFVTLSGIGIFLLLRTYILKSSGGTK
ncbi:FAD/NAD(P)-binding:oxidoreductase [Labilibaculum filiforme]|uniref:FAD/NAD(P)-binding:oxidoreductase n=1 Tax=Labilibaculum filiforme TaxID=1940526 RepID=A0A2N3HW93_9BACT|nr:ferric reductase-like transmembrane domain-containing protein [Labilibaculum filiforme]PKQ62340.1 FAD/NAD(P)-binding:oxidoreductase [Labilibaculum filiforme]